MHKHSTACACPSFLNFFIFPTTSTKSHTALQLPTAYSSSFSSLLSPPSPPRSPWLRLRALSEIRLLLMPNATTTSWMTTAQMLLEYSSLLSLGDCKPVKRSMRYLLGALLTFRSMPTVHSKRPTESRIQRPIPLPTLCLRIQWRILAPQGYLKTHSPISW